MKSFTLSQLNELVQVVIEQSLQDSYWLQAEIAECRESRGHLYLDLVEYSDDVLAAPAAYRYGRPSPGGGRTPVARAQARCWASTWQMVRPRFEHTAGQPLRSGMKVLMQVRPQFHIAYGFSWIVDDIDPTFTLGDMARRRQEIVRKLKSEGIFDMQKELLLPRFCQRIAVISSNTAAGYGDFCRQLADNDYGFAFTTRLFEAVMQGEQTEQSIIRALGRIFDEQESFDCVVIIRGGGATADMSGFDSLPLAEHVAQFPLPIITGIGHDRDECILDMVACQRVKTPTAAAALLIDNLVQVLSRIEQAQERIVRQVQQLMAYHGQKLTALQERIPMLFSLVSTRHQARLDRLTQRLAAAPMQTILRERHGIETLSTRLASVLSATLTARRHSLDLIAQRTASLDPAIILSRGYSITLVGGKAVTDVSALKAGDTIETRLYKGRVTSTVTSKTKKN